MNIISDTFFIDAKQNIDFDEIKTNEELLIETQNSTYKFCVRDAASRRGVLSGGALGDAVKTAIFIGAIAKNGERYVSDYWGLRRDARALFFLETENGMKHLITSPVTNLVHVKPEGQNYIC
jgi:hypothetical protein